MNRPITEKTRFALIAILILLVALISASCKKEDPKQQTRSEPESPVQAQAAEPEPEPIYSPIDGLEIEEDQLNLRPIAIMVENSYPIRPQEGLSKAEIVFEGLSEAGITRLVAIFTHNDVEKIGPVRSARNHFVAMAKGFNAIYGHCGGSIFALDLIKQWQVADFDQMIYPNSYWRVSDRKKPHNLFTSTTKIREDAKAAGMSVFYEPEGFLHKDDLKLESRVATQNITIEFSTAPYRVEYKYDRNTNQYLRYNAGVPHLDKTTNTQLSPKNVIVMFADTAPIPGGSGCLDVNVTGRNRMIAFIDGNVIDGYWQKPSPASQVKFYDGSASELELNRGQTWVEIVQSATPVTY